MKFSSSIPVLATRFLFPNKPTICITNSPTTSCPNELPFSDGFCNNCDALSETNDLVFCTRGNTTSQFLKEALPFCDEPFPDLLEAAPWACEYYRCPKGIPSGILDDRKVCFFCDEQNLDERKCSSGERAIAINDAKLLPDCAGSSKITLPTDYPSICKTHIRCSLGQSIFSYPNLCHNCDSLSVVAGDFECTKKNKTIRGSLGFSQSCQSAVPVVPDLHKEEPVVCRSSRCATFQSSLNAEGFSARCHNCDSLSQNGTILTCKRQGSSVDFEDLALMDCNSKTVMDLSNPATCKSYTCPLGARSLSLKIAAPGLPKHPNLCHSCDSMKVDSNGQRTCVRGHMAVEFNDNVAPDCFQPKPTKVLSNETRICKSREQCPFGVSSQKAPNGMYICSTCDSVYFGETNITCLGGSSPTYTKYDSVQPCYENTNPLHGFSADSEGGVCKGDYSCPNGTQKVESPTATICHNCDFLTIHASTTCLKNSRKKNFESLPSCGDPTETKPFESLLDSSPPYVCNAVFFESCPLLAQSTVLDGKNLLCHNCDQVSDDTFGYLCHRGNKTIPVDATICTDKISTKSPTNTPNPTRSHFQPTTSPTASPTDRDETGVPSEGVPGKAMQSSFLAFSTLAFVHFK